MTVTTERRRMTASTWPRVYRVLRDYEPLGALAGDHIWYDLREPNPVRLVRLADDHGRMLGAELDGVLDPLDGAPLPSHGTDVGAPRLTVLK